MAPLIEVNAFTHQGRLRADNEDSITVAGWVSDVEMSGPRRSRHELAEPLLVAVADGMGGHTAGEVASRYAIKRLAGEAFAGGGVDVAATLAAINAELYQTMAAAPSFLGMGTTVVGLLLTAGRACWFNVGDSRLYRLHQGRLDQLSIDDVPPGARSGTITQSLGGAPAFVPIAPHIGVEDLALPSRWLLCSDGLSDMLSDADITRCLEDHDEEAARKLFEAAMVAGGVDRSSSRASAHRLLANERPAFEPRRDAAHAGIANRPAHDEQHQQRTDHGADQARCSRRGGTSLWPGRRSVATRAPTMPSTAGQEEAGRVVRPGRHEAARSGRRLKPTTMIQRMLIW